MASPWRRFSLQVNPIGFVRKKSEPTVTSSRTFASPQQQTSKQGTGAQYLSSQGGGRHSTTDGNGRPNRTASPTPKGNASGNSETTPGAVSTPGSPRRLVAKHRDSSPASSGGGGGGSTKANTAGMLVASSGPWYDEMPGGSGGEGLDEVDGAGSACAGESRSSGGGSPDWPAAFPDGSTSLDVEKLRLMNKIEHVKDKLVAANKTKEAEVDEFLRLTSNVPVTADNPQMLRIRQVFEKKNKKSAHTIMTLQKKLDSYQQKLKDLELGNTTTSGGSGTRKQKSDNMLTNVGQGLKDVGANIKESLTGYTGGVFENIKGGLSGLSSVSHSAAGTVISVPKDLAHKLLKKSGSADNIHTSNQNVHVTQVAPAAVIQAGTPATGQGIDDTSLPNSMGRLELGMHQGGSSRSVHGAPTSVFYTDFDIRDRDRDGGGTERTSAATHRSVSPPSIHPTKPMPVQETPRRAPPPLAHAPSVPKYDQQQQAQFDQLLQEMQALKRSNDQMTDSLNELKSKVQHEYTYLHTAMHELTFRVQRLEDQLNDQADLHSAEVNGIRGDLQTVEARVSYQMSQIDGDLKDVIGRVTTRVEALEHRMKDQFGVDQNAVGTLAIRAGYLLAQTFLTIVFLLTQGLLPFMKTRARSVSTVVAIIVAIVFFRNLDVFEEWTLRFSRRA